MSSEKTGNMIIELAPHIKWSENKSGAILIYDRINQKSFVIDTISGKIIWREILRKTSLGQLVEETKRKFRTDRPLNQIEHDVIDFIKDLANANVVCVLKRFLLSGSRQKSPEPSRRLIICSKKSEMS